LVNKQKTSKVWEDLNRLFEPAYWKHRKMLAPYWKDVQVPGATKDYSEYWNKCRWENLEEGKISKKLKENPSFYVQLRSAIDEAARRGDLDSYYGDNKLVVMAAVRRDGLQLQFASERLRDDYNIVLTAVKQNGLALEFASGRLQNNRDIVLAAVKQNGLALEFASVGLRKNRDIVLEAVKQNGMAIRWASERLRRTSKIIITAREQNYLALAEVPEDLRPKYKINETDDWY
jgi:hypothetical protein